MSSFRKIVAIICVVMSFTISTVAFATEDYCLEENKINLDMSEEELLARIAVYEGGNYEEQVLIMEAVASRKYIDEYPDDIKSIVCLRGWFFLSADIWNEMPNPSDELIDKAKEILKKGEVSQYTQYVCNLDIAYIKYIDQENALKTEHYTFY